MTTGLPVLDIMTLIIGTIDILNFDLSIIYPNSNIQTVRLANLSDWRIRIPSKCQTAVGDSWLKIRLDISSLSLIIICNYQ